MKENDNGTDTNVGSIENSIEEDIKTLENLLDEGFEAMCYEEAQAIKHILSDYKRVLKENEKINSLIRKLKKDSKERQWIQTADDEYLAYNEKAMYADELLSFLRGEE